MLNRCATLLPSLQTSGPVQVQTRKQKRNDMKTKFKPSKILIFQESDGFHWNSKEEAKSRGYLDARGKGYKTKSDAMRAAREHFENTSILTHM